MVKKIANSVKILQFSQCNFSTRDVLFEL